MRHRLAIPALAAVLCLVAVGCNYKDVLPTGKAPLRYRDAVFTGVTKTTGITYGNATGFDGQPEALTLDLYQPTGDTVARRPLMIYVHGGSFSSGDSSSPELVDEATTLVKQGYVVASINYRLADVGCAQYGPECLPAIHAAFHDAQAAVRYFRNKDNTYRIDTHRIAMGGSSAGAITALNVDYAGKDVGASGTPGPSSKIEAAVSLSGAALLTTPAPGDAPALDFHGTADDLVPFSWSTQTVDRATQAGDHIEQTVWQGDGHVPYVKHRAQILTETSNFLYAALDLAHAAR